MKDRILHPVHAVMDRLGRRGTVLAVFALVFLFTGIKGFVDPSADAGRFMLYAMLPPIARLLLWGIPAVLALIAAVQKARHNDAYGFSALAIPAVVLTISYTVSWVGHLMGITSYGTGWVSALQWLLILTLLMVTSGWTEVKRHVIKESTGSIPTQKGGGDE